MTGVIRLAASAAAAVAVLVLIPLAAGATVSGGCTASATASVSGTQDLTSIGTWHLKDADVVNGSGKPPSEQVGVDIGAYVFGIPFTLYSDSSKGKGGKAGPYKVSDYDFIARVIEVQGSSGGGACTGNLLVIVDDKAPVATVVGGGGLGLAILGLLLILVAARTGGFGGRFVGLIGGLLAGAGISLALTQFEAIRPDSIIGLVVVIAGVLIGILLGGSMARKRPVSAPPPA